MEFTKIRQYRINYFEMPIRKFLLLFIAAFLCVTCKTNAQTVLNKATRTDTKIINDSINHKIDIAFTADKEISNLLILVTDSLGNTMFLENKYRFKGEYKQSIDLKNAKKGKYFLKLVKDKEQINKKISVE